MALEIVANVFLGLAFTSITPWDLNEQSGHHGTYSGPSNTRYYFPNVVADYTEADEICQNNYGTGYGLAVILTKNDLDVLTASLSRNVSPRTELWIGGSWYEGGKQFVWTKVRDVNNKPRPLAKFVSDLFDKYPSHPTVNDRIIFYMKDQFTAALKTEMATSIRRFICEYREDRQQ